MTAHVWTSELDQRLRELHAEGLKFKLIAAGLNAEYGTTFTRNSCIGRAHRLELPTRAEPTGPVKKPKPKRNRGQDKARVAPIPPPVHIPAPSLVPGRLTMLQLTRFTCRWPSGDRAPYTYCGDRVEGDGPFCREHAKLAYNKRGADLQLKRAGG